MSDEISVCVLERTAAQCRSCQGQKVVFCEMSELH